MQQTILDFLVQFLTTNPQVSALPIAILVIAGYKVAKIRGMSANDYQERVTESVADTISQEKSSRIQMITLQIEEAAT